MSVSAPVRFGVLGAGAIARDQALPALAQASNARAELLGSRDPAGRRDLARRLAVARGVATLEDVIADDAVDAVYVCLPNSLHCEWILKALAAGKPVLSEKPMAVTAAEAAAIAEASRRTGLAVMEGFMYRFHPRHRHIRELLDQSALGEVREVRASFEYRMLADVGPDDIRLTDGPGAGALLDMGCYAVSAARMALAGEPVAATGWRRLDPTGAFDIGGLAVLAFPGGRRAEVRWAFDADDAAELRIIGSTATLRADNPFVPGQGTPAATALSVAYHAGAVRELAFEPVNQFRLEFEEFAAGLTEGRDPVWAVDDAVAQANAMELVKALPTLRWGPPAGRRGGS